MESWRRSSIILKNHCPQRMESAMNAENLHASETGCGCQGWAWRGAYDLLRFGWSAAEQLKLATENPDEYFSSVPPDKGQSFRCELCHGVGQKGDRDEAGRNQSKTTTFVDRGLFDRTEEALADLYGVALLSLVPPRFPTICERRGGVAHAVLCPYKGFLHPVPWARSQVGTLLRMHELGPPGAQPLDPGREVVCCSLSRHRPVQGSHCDWSQRGTDGAGIPTSSGKRRFAFAAFKAVLLPHGTENSICITPTWTNSGKIMGYAISATSLMWPATSCPYWPRGRAAGQEHCQGGDVPWGEDEFTNCKQKNIFCWHAKI